MDLTQQNDRVGNLLSDIELSNQVQHLDKKELNKSCGER